MAKRYQTVGWSGCLAVALLVACGEPTRPDKHDVFSPTDGILRGDLGAPPAVSAAVDATQDVADLGPADAAQEEAGADVVPPLGDAVASDADAPGPDAAAGDPDAGSVQDGDAETILPADGGLGPPEVSDGADIPDVAGDAADGNADGADAATTAVPIQVTVSADPDVKATIIEVSLAPAELYFAGKITDLSLSTAVFSGKAPPLPATFSGEVAPGAWVVLVMVVGPKGPEAGGSWCAAGAPKVLQVVAGPLPEVAVTVHKFSGPPTSAALCGIASEPAWSPGPFLATPPTQWGGAHHMQAVHDGERMWVAGSQDGLVSFDLPPPPSAPPGLLGNWAVHQGMFCNRLAQAQGTVYCSSRGAYLSVFAIDPKAAKQTPQKVWLPGEVRTEGLGARGAVLWVAAHQQGLIAREAASPWGPLDASVPAAVSDAWDVTPVGDAYLAVAGGTNGLHMLKMTGATSGTLATTLALPGRAAFLSASPGMLLVSSLGAGLHAVDVQDPQAPKLVATFAAQENVFAATWLGGHVVAATGFHLLVLDTPQAGVAWRAQRQLPSFGYALDVDAVGPTTVRSAEFLGVRQIGVGVKSLGPGPVLMTQVVASAHTVAVGQPIVATLWLHNAGAQPLQVFGLVFDEVPPFTVPKVALPGAYSLAPGQSLAVPVQAQKTQKGFTNHRIILQTNDPEAMTTAVNLQETAWLQVGDALPAVTYQDATGKPWSTANHFAGKVGVLIIAAQSCPVAFLGLASAGVDLAELLNTGKIAALAINPWDKPTSTAETGALQLPFPVTYSPLTTSDGHDGSAVLDEIFGQAGLSGPPMPIVYVVDKKGKIVLAKWGYEAATVLAAANSALAAP